MNIWVTKIGDRCLTTRETNAIDTKLAKFPALQEKVVFKYQINNIDYYSVSTSFDICHKEYNYVDDNNNLIAYSGLIVANKDTSIDYRSAKNIKYHYDNLEDITFNTIGQYSVLTAGNYGFKCIVDYLGSYKVYYYQSNISGDIYITNYLPLISVFKSSDINVHYYVEYLSAKITSGYSTVEKDVLMLPEFGLCQWSAKAGFKTARYSNFSRLLIPAFDYHELVDNAVLNLQNASNYLTKYHKSVVPISGGLDSRIVLDMFWGYNGKQVLSFTRPDHYYDTVIANKVVKERGLLHQEIKPGAIPEIEDLNCFFKDRQESLPSYSYVYHYLFDNILRDIFFIDCKVQLFGLSGNIDKGLMLLPKKTKILSLGDTISALADKIIIWEKVLLPDAYHELHKRLNDYYQDKYLGLLSNTEVYRLGSFYFHCEYFRASTCRNLITNQLWHGNDLLIPLSSESLVHAIFNSPKENIMRFNRNSIHHELSKRLTRGQSKRISFTTIAHWDHLRISRLLYHFKLRLIGRMRFENIWDTTKYSDRIRRDYFRLNRKLYFDIISSNSKSEIWRHINRDMILGWLTTEGKNINKNQANLVSQIAGLLNNKIL